MGSGSSKPPPQRTSVRAYPGSKPRPATPSSGEGPHYKTPRSGTPTSGVETEAPAVGSGDPKEAATPAAGRPCPAPRVVKEEELIAKAQDERDVIIDDGESVTGRRNPEMTIQGKNVQKTEMGRQVTKLDCRSNAEDQEGASGRPQVDGGLWTDPEFTQEVAMKGFTDEIKWVRPKDFMDDPHLYSDGTSRFDIEQGSVGDCWFLSVLQSLADKPEYLSWIIPEDSYRLGGEGYDGIFHCRFWNFGHWEDVYVDDYLPVMHGKPWGARSRTDPNELWVSLIEKALAKFSGSYEGCTSGIASRAFSTLTGGTSELFDLDEITPKDAYRRLKNSLNCGSIIPCSVHSSGSTMGLVGNHSYSITGICKVVYRSKYLPLVRIRNPWGERRGEWKGAWSDKSSQWSELGGADKDVIQNKVSGDGEFWMSLTDFFQYFSSMSICNFTPDVDQDGKTDDMNNAWELLGEWLGESAAGCDDKQMMKNPKFMFEIPTQGVSKTGTPLCIDFTQKTRHRFDEDVLCIRCDLFKIEATEGSADAPCRLLRQLTSVTTYWGGRTFMYRYPALTAGKYLLVPHYSDPAGNERHFLLRLFTQVKIHCEQVKETSGFFVSEQATSFEHGGTVHQTTHVGRQFGMWVAGKNAGGQISHNSVCTNPQYLISVRGQVTTPHPCAISLVRELSDTLPIGLRLFRWDKTKMPVNTAWLYANYSTSPFSTGGDQTAFVNGSEAELQYMLPVGDYVLLVHSNNPNEEGRFFVQVAGKQKISIKAFNDGR